MPEKCDANALSRKCKLAIFYGKVLDSIEGIVGGGRLVALEKPDNRGVCPIVVVDTPRNLALSTIAKNVTSLSSQSDPSTKSPAVSCSTQKLHLQASVYFCLNKTMFLLYRTRTSFSRMSRYNAP